MTAMQLRAPVDREVSIARAFCAARLWLQEAERLLVGLKTETPDPERAAQLVLVRDVIVRLGPPCRPAWLWMPSASR